MKKILGGMGDARAGSLSKMLVVQSKSFEMPRNSSKGGHR